MWNVVLGNKQRSELQALVGLVMLVVLNLFTLDSRILLVGDLSLLDI